MAKRPVILASVSVVLVGAAGATTVFLPGSAQRRDDRAALQRYESGIVGPLHVIDRVVEQVNPSIEKLRAHPDDAGDVPDRVEEWRRDLTLARVRVLAVRPPEYLRDIGRRWVAAIDAYLRAADLVERAARSTGSGRTALLTAARAADEEADRLLDSPAGVVRFHRHRLGVA
jgi:predicted component of type VI protein secretion system